MKDQVFTICREPHIFFGGEIKDGRLHLVSEVYGEYDSEQNYSFSKEDTDKLFSLISLEDFCALCRREHLQGMDAYLEKHGIRPGVFTV